MAEVVKTSVLKAKGHYTPAIKVGSEIILSGQVAGENADAETETRDILNHLKEFLSEQGLALNSVLKITVYLADLRENIAGFKNAYEPFWSDWKPARTLVGVSELPLGRKVMMDFIIGE